MSQAVARDKRRRISLTSLPTEVIECIIAKCMENDRELLHADPAKLIKTGNDSAGTNAKDDDGWETEDESEDVESEDEAGFNDEAKASTGSGSENRSSSLSNARLGKDQRGVDNFEPGAGNDADGVEVIRNGQLELSVHQLAQTCKILRVLALPTVYAGVDFEGLTNRVLKKFLKLIAANHGHLVKNIWIRVSVNENQEFAAISWFQADDEDEFYPGARYDLVVEILQSLPNLVAIDIDLPSVVLENYPKDEPPTLIEDVIESRADKLVRLALTGDVYDRRLPVSTVAGILAKMKKLESLELTSVDTQYSHGPVLKDILAGLEHLHTLELTDVLCLTDDWADTKWTAHLKVLDLDDCQNITHKGVEKLFEVHAATLRSISLQSTPYMDGEELDDGPSYDFPQLEDLCVDHPDLSTDFVSRFAYCPNLARIELGEMQDSEPHQLQSMLEFERATIDVESGGHTQSFPALKELVLSAADWQSESPASLESLQVFCFAHDITVTMEEDSDDELSDEYSMYSDDMAHELGLEVDQDDEGEFDDEDDDFDYEGGSHDSDDDDL